MKRPGTAPKLFDVETRRSTTTRRLGHALWICGAIVIALATLTPSDQSATTSQPCLICGDLGVVDAVLNVLLFVPVGVGLALARVRASRAIPAMIAATCAIEAVQIVAVAGRDASVGDLLTNSVGGIIGFVAGSRLHLLLRPSQRVATGLLSAWLVLFLAAQTIGSYAMQPDPTDSRYFGQIARALGGHPPYAGRVLSATLGGQPVPDFDFDNSGEVREELGRAAGAPLSFTVIPAHAQEWPASIVRIADAEEREILQASDDRGHLVFGVRTRADALRLRSISYRLRNAFPDGDGTPGRDTIHIQARFSRSDVSLAASNGKAGGASRIALTPAASWRLVFPATTYFDGSATDAMLNAAWLFTLLAPAGFWGALAGPPRGRHDRTGWTVRVGLLAVLIVGFWIAPVTFGLDSPAWTELLAGIAALAAGAAMAGLVRRGSLPPHSHTGSAASRQRDRPARS